MKNWNLRSGIFKKKQGKTRIRHLRSKESEPSESEKSKYASEDEQSEKRKSIEAPN